MQFLLPNGFKKAGAVMAPLGFACWLAMQGGLTKKMFQVLQHPGLTGQHQLPAYFAAVNSGIAIVSFFSFLTGIYFLAFSKEKVEDEMIAKTRLDSFQFAALVQLACLTAAFAFIAVSKKEPGSDAGYLLFFITAVLLFWTAFLFRFHYVLYRQRMNAQ